jgi:hypothetical protein
MDSERPVSTSEVTGLFDFERETIREYKLLEDNGILNCIAERPVSVQFHLLSVSSHTYTQL